MRRRHPRAGCAGGGFLRDDARQRQSAQRISLRAHVPALPRQPHGVQSAAHRAGAVPAAARRAGVPADRMAPARRPPPHGDHGARRRRLHRRHDRPLRARRASPAVRPIRADVINLFRYFHDIAAAEIGELARAGVLPAGLDTSRIAVEPPRDPNHGDVSTNAAMVLAKPAGMAPRALAEKLVERLKRRPEVVAAAPAGPGFINLRLADGFWHERLAEIVRAGPAYGDSRLGAGKPVNIEYVSANPTGPMHVGHGRGAVVGDALAALLDKVGFAVTREYYINDAGAQVDVLARSAYLRYSEALGESVGAIPEGLYPGDYLKETGRALAARDGRKWLDAGEEVWLPAVRD